jgi:L-rhamnose mutarotase
VKRVSSIIHLQPEWEQEYRALHAAVWPSVIATLHNADVRNFSIFLRGNLLVSYFEYVGANYEESMSQIANDPATREWWKLTDRCQQPVSDIGDGGWWAEMEEIFHVDL